MRIEYFQLIDRIIDLNLNDLTIRVEANVPTESTIFEGHFPGRPLMPGVLLIEAMAQASGWLIIARTRFEQDAVPRRAEGGQAAHLRHARPGARGDGEDHARGLGLCADRGRDQGRRQDGLQRRHHVPRRRFSGGRIPRQHCTRSRSASRSRWKRWPMADAKRPRGLDHRHRHRVVSRRGAGRALAGARRGAIRRPTRPPTRPTSFTRSRRSTSTSRSRRRATSARWRRGSASAPMRPGSRSTPPASKATPKSSRAPT